MKQQQVEGVLSRIASWTVPVNVLIWMAGKAYDTQQFRRSWLPPEVASRVEKMPCDGFTPAETVRLKHRLALADLEIRWDSDGADDVILGIGSTMWQWVKDVIGHATYDLSTTLKIIADDHPHLRRGLMPISLRLNKIAIGQ